MKAPVCAVLLMGAAFVGSAAAQTSTSYPRNCAALGELPKSWEGKAYAIDGATLAATGLKGRIRLWGIRAPDMPGSEIVPAMRARAALEDMLVSGEHKVSCRMIGTWDEQCRAVAQCTITAEWPRGTTAQSHDLALRLVEDGFAYGAGLDTPPEWDKDAGEKIAHFEAIARQARKGLWSLWLGEQPKP